ncbi:MAG: LysM peptidoglycan-binding domain-containing protein [Acidimicrobiales bacterium]|nr:LysM peptidoglycan-binding domain-containing protein [Acidimicrobiales bacterium]
MAAVVCDRRFTRHPDELSPYVGAPAPAALYRRRRLAAVLVAVVVLLAPILAVRTLAATLGGVPASAPEAPLDAPRVHVVQPGDTLWAVAAELTPSGGDVRATVDLLADLNGGAATLQVGQRLLLP